MYWLGVKRDRHRASTDLTGLSLTMGFSSTQEKMNDFSLFVTCLAAISTSSGPYAADHTIATIQIRQHPNLFKSGLHKHIPDRSAL